jgi:hypothetical protein
MQNNTGIFVKFVSNPLMIPDFGSIVKRAIAHKALCRDLNERQASRICQRQTGRFSVSAVPQFDWKTTRLHTKSIGAFPRSALAESFFSKLNLSLTRFRSAPSDLR